MLTHIDIVPPKERRWWINEHGVIMCDHGFYPMGLQKEHMKVIGAFGNAIWICESCLHEVKRELTPTSR